jgi:hypothetical protein
MFSQLLEPSGCVEHGPLACVVDHLKCCSTGLVQDCAFVDTQM